MTGTERKAFLQFTTGCSSLPPGGLANLHPRWEQNNFLTTEVTDFSIPRLTIVRKIDAGDGSYPSVNTCVHYLKVSPIISNYDELDDECVKHETVSPILIFQASFFSWMTTYKHHILQYYAIFSFLTTALRLLWKRDSSLLQMRRDSISTRNDESIIADKRVSRKIVISASWCDNCLCMYAFKINFLQ